MDTIGFGSRADADRATRRVRAMHRRVRGVTAAPAGRFPAGTPYAADDPELLLWILACLADSALVVYQKYVRTPTRDERDAYWRDYRQIGRLFGLRDAEMPADDRGLRRLHGRDAARRRPLRHAGGARAGGADRAQAAGAAAGPPAARARQPDHRRAAPGDIRRQYGLRWDPARALALHGGAEYVKRVVVPLLPGRLRLVPRARAA